MRVSCQRHARPRFTPGERTPGTHWTGGCAGLRAVLDTEVRGKILCPVGDRTSVIQSLVSHYMLIELPQPPVCYHKNLLINVGGNKDIVLKD
jgi:hypothetical protein